MHHRLGGSGLAGVAARDGGHLAAPHLPPAGLAPSARLCPHRRLSSWQEALQNIFFGEVCCFCKASWVTQEAGRVGAPWLPGLEEITRSKQELRDHFLPTPAQAPRRVSDLLRRGLT